jgi:Leucine-rich repeat (LRR) protein
LPKPDKPFFLCLDEATDEEWKQLATFPNLVGVQMHRSDISEIGIAHLCKNRTLRAFAGRRLNLTDKAVKHLASCKEMTHLCIWDSHFHDKLSMKRFSQFEKLECLTLSFNDPYVDTESFPTFKKLKYLDISLSSFERPSLEDLKDLSNLEHLDLAHSRNFGNDLTPLQHLQQLKKLDLASTKIDKAARKVVGSLKNLRSLNLNYTGLTLVGLPEIAKLEHLEELDLGANKISDTTVQSLTPLRNLRKLNLADTPITNQSVPFLLDFPKLEELNVANTAILSSGKAKLKAIPTLKKLKQ